MIGLKVIYIANILVAGWISITCLFNPTKGVATVFENAIAYSEGIRLIGALWFAIFVLSIIGLFFPQKMSLVLLFQLIYKGSWLVVVAVPAIQKGLEYPRGMATFFLVWVIVLPFVIPWKYLFSN
ncbi:hypothetical protein EAX61_02185 [Dokdonia sinensis]|uniref:Uncharacterized protein n=1 Tax=Dokdonia sinensis TaxID=2479847 RepID=A0A3M0GEP9_9FLAO|nr:hypothetical protein [Dokdonia sinensis]RMB63224.1 hypothetical protein EAX61_02185 [Dokdonia sinensis]